MLIMLSVFRDSIFLRRAAPVLNRWIRRQNVEVHLPSEFRVLSQQPRKIPSRPRRRTVRVRAGAPPDNRPPFHLGSEQMLAKLWFCTHISNSSYGDLLRFPNNVGDFVDPAS
jgi:hypothetical protein